jgi:hypothetical protein
LQARELLMAVPQRGRPEIAGIALRHERNVRQCTMNGGGWSPRLARALGVPGDVVNDDRTRPGF